MCLHPATCYSAAISSTHLLVDVWMESGILLCEPHLGESSQTEAKADTWRQGEKQGNLGSSNWSTDKDIPKCLTHNQ